MSDKIKVFMASLSAKVVELLKTKFGLDMKAIYRFELQELQLMDVESDLPAASSLSSSSLEEKEKDNDDLLNEAHLKLFFFELIIAGAGAIHIDPTWFHCRLVATSILLRSNEIIFLTIPLIEE